MRDAAVQDAIDDLFRHHDSLRDLGCTVEVRGGVAHAHGILRSHAERDLARRALARVRGVTGVWDTFTIEGGKAPRIVDLGCGGSKQVEGAFGVDAHPHAGVDLVTDIEGGLPFTDASVDYVFAAHFLEHIRDLVALMNEIHRVLKPGGALHAMVPHERHVNASADPTHVRYFNAQTFRYFCEPRPNTLPWRPICVSDTGDNVLADLEPVSGGHPSASLELALFFD